MSSSDFVIVKNILVRYKGADPFVDIPDGVVAIGKQAFYYQDIKTVSMPESVTVIDDEAFSNCNELYEVELSSNILRIGYEAFANCGALESLSLPEVLTEIENGAFSECWNLKEIKIPDAVTRLGSRAFRNTRIEEVSIPEEITYIDSDTFASCRELKRVILPDNLKSVGPRAFENCRELAEINFPSTIDEVGIDAFKGCNKVTAPARRNQETDPRENGFVIINGVLSSYSGDDRVVRIPEGVTRINDGAFQKNSRISKVILPDSLTSIGSVAFYECYNLRDINISSKVTDIENNAFIDCRKLADENGFVIFNNTLFGYYGDDDIVVIPEGVETIGSCSFGINNNIFEEVVLPETVDVIKENAFSCCRNMKSIAMPKSMKKIERGAFSYCDNLESIRIPDGIETLSYNVLNGCRRLEEVILPASLKRIEIRAIEGCPFLMDIVIPEGVEEIGGGQFENCDNLREITIPETVKSFGDSNIKGIQLNIRKLGKTFSFILLHKWGAREEQCLWEMLNDPSMATFDSIKTTAYKIALAERLYPEYVEYRVYLKKNIKKAIKDAISFGDYKLLESLRNTGFIESSVFEEEISKVEDEKRKELEAKYKATEEDINCDKVINTIWLRRKRTDLEKMSNYLYTSELIHSCSKRIEELEHKHKEILYKEACEDMDKYGGMSWVYLNPAIQKFREIKGYKDADDLLLECRRRLEVTWNENREKAYQKAVSLYESFDGSNRDDLEEAIDLFERLPGYKDSDVRLGSYYKQFWDYEI